MQEILEESTWYNGLANEGRRVVSRAFHYIDGNYGTGQSTVVSPYYYHNGLHTRLACEDFAVLRDTLGLTPAEFLLGVTAMAAHDVIKTFGRESGQDEAESADWLESQLETLPGASQLAITTGRLAVIGTTPRFQNGTIVQRAVEQVYPTKRAELIAHGVAGADVGRLFTPQGPWLSHLLYQEMQAANDGSKTAIDELLPFQNSQIEFLVNYAYPSRDIENSLATHKAPVIRYLSELSRMLEAGSIESWDELAALDQAFANNHSV